MECAGMTKDGPEPGPGDLGEGFILLVDTL